MKSRKRTFHKVVGIEPKARMISVMRTVNADIACLDEVVEE
jgi:hypothetical protein